MTFRVEVGAEARGDITEAYSHYAGISPRLADGFLRELDGFVRRIATMPEMYPVWFADVRGVEMRRFPYLLPYWRLDEATYEVLGCYHARRDRTQLVQRRWLRR